MKKLTQEQVEKIFLDEGCELLDVYVNQRTKVKYRCSCGELSVITISDFKTGRRCGCGNKKHGIERRFEIEEVKQTFEENSCILLEKEYTNSRTKMRYICSCGQESQICYSSFKQGRRCFECGKEKNRVSQEEVEKYFIENKCKLISAYVSRSDPVEYLCEHGKQCITTYESFKRGCRCMCGVKKDGKKKKYSIEEAKIEFGKLGYELLTEEKEDDKYNYKCICGESCWITITSLLRGRTGCKKCEQEKRNKPRKYNIEIAQKIFKENNCVLLEDEYVNARTMMRYICKCGRESQIDICSFNRGQRCWQCGIDSKRKPWYLLKKRYKTILRNTLRAINRKRNNTKHCDLLGYKPIDLWERINNHPNWERVKDGKWHLDHIFPIVAFLEHGIHDIKIINALDNLQPLESKENISKGGKYNEEEFFSWLKTKGVSLPTDQKPNYYDIFMNFTALDE